MVFGTRLAKTNLLEHHTSLEVPPMIAKALQGIPLQGKTLLNRVLIPVAWDEAERICTRLRERGIEATACFDAAEHSAGLELPAGTDYETAQQILDAFSQGGATPK
jgi:hypothetical protein